MKRDPCRIVLAAGITYLVLCVALNCSAFAASPDLPVVLDGDADEGNQAATVVEAVESGDRENISHEKTCRECHNEESPGYTPFNFEERVKKIEHHRPPAEE